MPKSKKILFIALFFVLGIILAEEISVSFFGLYVVTIAGVVIWFLFDSDFKRFLAVLFLFFLAGIWRMELAQFFKEKSFKLVQDINFKEDLIFKGIVFREPEIKNKQQDIMIKTPQKEVVLVKTLASFLYLYGDELEIVCHPGKTKKKTTYQKDFTKENASIICYYPKINLLARGKGDWVYGKILSFRQKSRFIVQKFLPPPESHLLAAMLLGYKKEISRLQKEKFSRAGLSHIVAISGMHLGILSFILFYFFILAGLWRQQALGAVIIFLWFYIAMIGFPASALRAGVMISALALGWFWGRISGLINVLVWTGIFLLFINPFLLKDIGFELSFLAVGGIVYLLPVFFYFFRYCPNLWGLKKIFLVTLSAQIFTLPLAVYYFGNMPVLSILANLSIIPLLPFILILGIYGFSNKKFNASVIFMKNISAKILPYFYCFDIF